MRVIALITNSCYRKTHPASAYSAAAILDGPLPDESTAMFRDCLEVLNHKLAALRLARQLFVCDSKMLLYNPACQHDKTRGSWRFK